MSARWGRFAKLGSTLARFSRLSGRDHPRGLHAVVVGPRGVVEGELGDPDRCTQLAEHAHRTSDGDFDVTLTDGTSALGRTRNGHTLLFALDSPLSRETKEAFRSMLEGIVVGDDDWASRPSAILT